MSDLVRFSFSIEKDLFNKMQKLIAKRNYDNRSEFLRDLLRDTILQEEKTKNRKVIGTILLVFDHHKRELGNKLIHLQHNHWKEIISTTHVHLDASLCAESIIIKGKYSDLETIASELGQQKGVIHSSISVGPLDE